MRAWRGARSRARLRAGRRTRHHASASRNSERALLWLCACVAAVAWAGGLRVRRAGVACRLPRHTTSHATPPPPHTHTHHHHHHHHHRAPVSTAPTLPPSSRAGWLRGGRSGPTGTRCCGAWWRPSTSQHCRGATPTCSKAQRRRQGVWQGLAVEAQREPAVTSSRSKTGLRRGSWPRCTQRRSCAEQRALVAAMCRFHAMPLAVTSPCVVAPASPPPAASCVG
jgi:hypothetical protein